MVGNWLLNTRKVILFKAQFAKLLGKCKPTDNKCMDSKRFF